MLKVGFKKESLPQETVLIIEILPTHLYCSVFLKHMSHCSLWAIGTRCFKLKDSLFFVLKTDHFTVTRYEYFTCFIWKTITTD